MKMTMRKMLAILATLAILCAVLPLGSLFSAVAEGDGNLVANGGFENGGEGWNIGAASISDDAHTGSAALKGENPSQWGVVAEQTISVEADSEYTITWYSKRVSGGGAFNLFPMNANGYANLNVVSGQSWMNETSGNWVKNQCVIETGSATSIILKFSSETNNAGVILIDDVTMTKVGGDAPVVPTGDNLLVNGDFETGDATGWNTWQSTEISAAAAKDGSFGAHLKGDGSWGGMLDQTATVEAGKQYKLTFWINVIKTGVNLQVLDGAGNKMDEAARWFDAKNVNKQVEITFTAPDNGVTINFCGAGNNVAEDVYVDNFVLKELTGGQPDAPSVELINGDFESGNEGWSLSSSASIYTEDAHGGNASLKLENPSAWSEAALQKVAVTANTEYVIELWTKRVSGGGAFNLFLMNSADNSNLELISGQNWFNTKDADWTKHTIVLNSGAATEITFKWSAEADNAGVLLVDDMTMSVKGEEPELPMNGAIVNGDFETGDLSGWENLYDSCVVSVNESSRYTGNYGLDFTAPGDWMQVVQVATVEPDTDYTLTVWAANAKNVMFIVKHGDDSGDIASATAEAGNEWKKYEVKFNSGKNEAVRVLIIGAEGGGNALVDTVGLYKTGEEPDEPDQPDDPVLPPISLSLDSFGTILNRPVSEEANLIVNGSFEKAEGGQWQDLVGDTFYVVDDETAPEGDKSLYFNTSGVEEQTKLVFWLDVTPNTDYVFSAWLKGAFISDDNRYDATIGVVDPNGNFLVFDGEIFSNKERQIVPPCWDNEWHLRSVTFNSGRAEQVGIAFAGKLSQLWIDSIALNTTNDAVRYADPAQFSYVGSLPSAKEYGGCADEDNLIPDANMDSDESVEFWSSAIGFENGFITFPENEYEYGTSMKYTQSSAPGGVHAIKWIDVKPNTNYTFSVDIRVVKEGGGKLVLMDNKLRVKEDFLMIDFDQFYYGVDWFNVTSEFSTGNFDRIGIAVVDGGGEALIDNMRLFESVNMIEGGVKDKYVEPPYSFNQPDSPETGVSVLGIVLAVAVVPTSAAVALGLRRKKEDEE